MSYASAQVQTEASENTPHSSEDGGEFHLRTYVNRIQIPTMVIAPNGNPVHDLETNSFSISLDSGPVFHPTYSRVEGDDPLSLSILVDAAGSQPELISRVASALASLVPGSLSSADHVSIYAADCTMYRTRLNSIATSNDIQVGVERALAVLHPLGAKKTVTCENHFRLWDFVSYVLQQTGSLPGRRVVLILSGGHEGSSKATWIEAARLATLHSTALIGVRDKEERAYEYIDAIHGTAERRTYENEDGFELLCASSGGTVFQIDERRLRAELVKVIDTVRNRYVLEFPEPDNAVNGFHHMDVTVPLHKHLLVRSTGAFAILGDPKLKNDPNVLPSQPSPSILGTRRPMENGSH